MRLFRSLFRGGARRAEAQNSEPEIEITEDVVAEIVAAAEGRPSAEVLTLHGDDRVVSAPSPRWYDEDLKNLQSEPASDALDDVSPEEPIVSEGVGTPVAPEAVQPVAADLLPIPAPEAEFEADPAVQRPRPKKGRVKTRLLGFGDEDQGDAADEGDQAEVNAVPGLIKSPVGWIVVVDGPGAGEWFTLNGGLASIGRGEDQTIRLDFGDMAISRSNHAALAYDTTDHEFLLGDGGKANSVLVNGVPRSGTSPVIDGDLISIGETTLRLVALCDKTFNWQPKAEGGTNNVGYA